MKKMISILAIALSFSVAFAQDDDEYSTSTASEYGDNSAVSSQAEYSVDQGDYAEEPQQSAPAKASYTTFEVPKSSYSTGEETDGDFRFGIYAHPISFFLYENGVGVYLDFEFRLNSRFTLLATHFFASSSPDDYDILEFGAYVGPRWYFSKANGGHRGWYAMAQLTTIYSAESSDEGDNYSSFGFGTIESVGYMLRLGGFSMSIDVGAGFAFYSGDSDEDSHLRNGSLTIYDMNITMGFGGF